MGAWVYGCMGAWVYGCMEVWMYASISVYGFVSLRQVCALVVLAHGFVVTRSKIMVTWFYGVCVLSVALVLLLLVVCTWLHIALCIVVQAVRVIYGLWLCFCCCM